MSGNTINSSKYRDSALFTLPQRNPVLEERTSTTDSAYAPVERVL
jgi:hypothetical protein